MSKGSRARALTAATVLALTASTAGTAVAKTPSTPKRATLDMTSKVNFKINRYVQDASRFSKDVTVIKSGGTLTVRNRSDGPHTLSFVPKGKLPRTEKQINNCFAPGTICGDLGTAHKIDDQGNPSVMTVDINQPGIDTASTAGDSWVFGPHQTQKLKVSAKKGANLWFLCAIHPWMQAELKVR
jgi:hypothetical protein